MCLFCTGYVAFKTQMEMHAHVKTVHQFDKISCPHYDLVFEKSDFQKLTMHIVNVHKPEEKIAKKPMIQCASCGAELTNKKAYADHLIRKGQFHDAKCRICDDFEAKTWAENKAHCDQVWSLSRFKVSRQLLTNVLNQVS